MVCVRRRPDRVKSVHPLRLVNTDKFSGGRGRCRTLIRCKICNTEVDFMPDGGYRRDVAGCNMTGDLLIIEGPQIFK